MLEDGDDVDACFMDFKKAFDLVNHRLLLVNLRALGLGEDCIAWVRAFLANREFRVRIKGEISEWETVPSGVPQGSVVGLLLFVVFINDLPEEMRRISFLFADDLQIVNKSSRSEDLSNDLQTAALLAIPWDM